jgi:hypothetical protein
MFGRRSEPGEALVDFLQEGGWSEGAAAHNEFVTRLVLTDSEAITNWGGMRGGMRRRLRRKKGEGGGGSERSE